MKKALCILLSLVMLFLFVSCGGGNDTAEETQQQGISSTEGIVSLEGKLLDKSIFEGKITMVNIWATFCAPCIREMPDLQKLHEDYADKGFQVIGIVCDIYSSDGFFQQSGISDAKEIVQQTGVKYLNLLPTDVLVEAKLKDVTSVPETFFLDENGKVIGSSYIGSRSYDQWAEIIDGITEQ